MGLNKCLGGLFVALIEKRHINCDSFVFKILRV
jgi:hypothetical protein